MAASVFDHPLTAPLFAGAVAAPYLSAEAEIAALIRFEAALAAVEGELGVIPAASAARIVSALTDARPDIALIGQAMARDGVSLPGLLAQLRPLLAEQDRPWLHWGATSQDAMDTALMLRLAAALADLDSRLAMLLAGLDRLDTSFGTSRLTGYTRMQEALPIAVSHRIGVWRDPFLRLRPVLARHRAEDCAIQLGGAVGDLQALGQHGPAIRAAMAERLGLADAPAWHASRDRIAAIGATLGQVAAACGKIGLDVALMTRDGTEITLSGGGTSSAMAHKKNPVNAEILVTLGHFAAAQSGLLTQSMIGEMERSGAAWSLEWMVLPPLLSAALAAAARTGELLDSIETLGLAAG